MITTNRQGAVFFKRQSDAFCRRCNLCCTIYPDYGLSEFGADQCLAGGRNLGLDFASSLIGPRLRKYDEANGKNGFATVLYLRFVYFPFTPITFGMGMTKMRFGDYLMGTGFGILASTFIFSFFLPMSVRRIWREKLQA